ncbi:MAG: bifunctional DNA-formamidopyrimidine glycosylase/DNA-(apurinic or apyrimidinic site) lyase [Bdellovibrionales bacterium]
MPELPEVETVRRGLSEILSSQNRIQRAELICGDLRRQVSQAELDVLKGQKILNIRRRAKYLLMETEQHVLINHLGMTGSWRVAAEGFEQKHDHFYLWLQGGSRLAFNDPRRFGLLYVVARGDEKSDSRLASLGPEPLEPDFNADWVFARTRKKQTALKVWLMDQRNVVGVGNIYASEALYRAGLKPQRRSGRLTHVEGEKLVRSVRDILKAAIKKGGSTIRDFKQTGGTGGYFQNQLLVYDRADEPCRACKTLIRSQVIGGRSTYWCAQCQS